MPVDRAVSKRLAARVLSALVALGIGHVAAAQAGNVETVAGGGSLPSLGSVEGLARDPATGNFYASGHWLNQVYSYDAATQNASVVAGDGFGAFEGDGGPATAARLHGPSGLVLDPTDPNRLYVAETLNHRVRLLNRSTGAITTVMGNGNCAPTPSAGDVAALAAELCVPSSLAIGADGTLYVFDAGTHSIWRMAGGLARAIVGDGVTTPVGNEGSLAVDSVRHKLYVGSSPATFGPGVVYAVDLTSFAVSTLFTVDPTAPFYGGGLHGRVTLAVREDTGALYYLDFDAFRLLVKSYDTVSGTSTVVVGGTNLTLPPFVSTPAAHAVLDRGVTAMAVTPGGGLLLASPLYVHAYSGVSQTLTTLLGNGFESRCGDGGPAVAGCLYRPLSALPRPDGSLILSDAANNAVRRVDPAGLLSTVADIDPLATLGFLAGNAAGEVAIGMPGGMADGHGHGVLAVDVVNGGSSPLAGTGYATDSIDGPGGDPRDDLGDGGPATLASFNVPMGLAYDAAGALFVADFESHRVRRIASGIVTTVGGDGTPDANPNDGNPATSSSFNAPISLAFDVDGSLLVLENGGLRLRRIATGADGFVTGAPDEVVVTVAGTGAFGGTGDGGPATDATFVAPRGLAVAPDGLYIADYATVVRRIDRASGLIDRLAGGGTLAGDGVAPLDADLSNAVVDVALTRLAGRRVLYIADFQNNRIRQVDLGPALNHVPVVDAGPDVEVVATSPLGAFVQLLGTASDEDGDALIYHWDYEVGTANFPSPVVHLPPGEHELTFAVSDGQGGQASDTVLVTVLAQNTFAGNGEVLLLEDDDFNIQGYLDYTPARLDVTVVGPVTAAGLTWFRSTTSQLPPPPTGFQLGSMPFYYDVATTAAVTGDVRVCVDLTGMSFVHPSAVRLYRLAAGSPWLDITTSVDPAAHRICAEAAASEAFGRYAVFTPADPATLVTSLPGLAQTAGLAFDAARGFLYASGIDHFVRRVDTATGSVTLVAGNGQAIGAVPPGGDALDSPLGPHGLALDADGNLFVADPSNCLIRRVDLATNAISTVAGHAVGFGEGCGHDGDGGPATAASLWANARLAFDPQGNLFFVQGDLSEPGGLWVRRVAAGADQRLTGADDPDEIITTIAGNGTGQFGPDGTHPLDSGIYPMTLTFGTGGSLYLGTNNGVLRIAPDGDGSVDGSAGEAIESLTGPAVGPALPYQGDGGLAGDALVYAATGLVVAPSGDVLFGDSTLQRVRRLKAGHVETIAGWSSKERPVPFNGDGYALSTSFSLLGDIASDGAGGLYVSDLLFDRVRHFGIGTGIIGATSADLSIGATAPATATVGQVLGIQLHVTNHGPASASGVVMSLPIDASVDFVGDDAVSIVCTGPVAGQAGTISCALGALFASASTSWTIEVRPHVASPFAGTLSIAGAEADPVPANNAATVNVAVELVHAVLNVLESLNVTDTASLRGSVRLSINEVLTVTDTPMLRGSVRLHVDEPVTVADAPTALPQGGSNQPPAVVLVQPSGGERLFTGTPYELRWTASDDVAVTSVDVAFSSDGGATFAPIPGCTALPGSAQGCLWASPGPITGAGRVRVTVHDAGSLEASATSAANVAVASGAASLRLTAPDTGVSWRVGDSRRIRFTHNLGSGQQVRIDLSRDGGGSWSVLEPAFVTGTGAAATFHWTVSGPPTTQARARVSWLGNAAVASASAVDFKIKSRIVVAQPDTGLRWPIGSTRTIRWQHNLATGETVDIDLSRDGGSTWTSLATSVVNASATAGSYSWTVGGPATTHGRVRVSRSSDPATADASDVDFTISGSLSLTAPAGAEELGIGTMRTLSWNHDLGAGQLFDIDLSIDGGVSFPIAIAHDVAAAAGSGTFDWLVAGPPAANARVRVRWTESAAVRATSAKLTLSPAFVQVASPNTNVAWTIGTARTLSVKHDLGPGQDLALELSRDGGASWAPIGTLTTGPAGSASFPWTVSGPVTTQARVRATWSADPAVSDTSDSDFRIR
jgi:sugar lactone lactonase YvrE